MIRKKIETIMFTVRIMLQGCDWHKQVLAIQNSFLTVVPLAKNIYIYITQSAPQGRVYIEFLWYSVTLLIQKKKCFKYIFTEKYEYTKAKNSGFFFLHLMCNAKYRIILLNSIRRIFNKKLYIILELYIT